jgi:ABC-type uncharacterized transport system permease subunit
MLLLVAMAAGCFVFSNWVWGKAVRNYTSASS